MTIAVDSPAWLQPQLDAHLLALQRMKETSRSARYNLGNGTGFSVQQVIDATRAVTGRDFVVTQDQRRPGDPAVLVADSTLAKKELGWQPEFPDLDSIIASAWHWEKGTPVPEKDS